MALPLLVVLVVGLLGNMAAIANPGVFNHDEIQAYEEADTWGVLGYARHYSSSLSAVDLGTPVRPVGRAIWGVQVKPLPTWPFLAHLGDVLAHLVNAMLVGLLAFALLRERARAVAVAAALLFAISPLTSLGTAWSAASFDRTYTTFVLISVLAVLWWLRPAGSGGRRRAALVLAGASALMASLSKETAVMLPVALVLWILLASATGAVRVRVRELWPVGVAVVLGLLPYLLFRILPGLVGSASGQETADAYDLQSGLVAQKALWFFAFPFAPDIVELQNLVFVSSGRIGLYVGIHLILCGLVLVGLGWRHLVVYLGLYFVFLAPILFVPNTNSHYLYGSAAGMAVVLALLFRGRFATLTVPVAAVLVVVMSYHHLQTQRTVYVMGRCQAVFFDTLGAQLTRADPAVLTAPIAVVPQPGSPGYVAARTTLGTTRIAEFGGLTLMYAATAADVPEEARLVVDFDDRCRAVPPRRPVGPPAGG